MMPRFQTSDGLSLHYTVRGDGPAVLCLAGLTRNGDDFAFLAPYLAGYCMITMDYRGRGYSDYDPNFMNYNVPREGLDAIELLDHLGVDHAAIIGTSRGGLIAMALAMTHKDRLSAVMLNDVGPVIEQAAIARIMDYVGQKPAARDFESAAQAMAHVFAEQFPRVPHERWVEVVKAQYDQSETGLTLRYDAKLRDALIEQAKAGPAPDLWPLFDALNGLPTGVIRGGNSDLLSAYTLLEMQSRMPKLRGVTIPDRGHVPFLDEPPAVALITSVLKDTL